MLLKNLSQNLYPFSASIFYCQPFFPQRNKAKEFAHFNFESTNNSFLNLIRWVNLEFPKICTVLFSFLVKGWGPDENAIMEILGHRNAKQRVEIALTYNRHCNESLIDRRKSELSGDFEVFACLFLFFPFLILVDEE